MIKKIILISILLINPFMITASISANSEQKPGTVKKAGGIEFGWIPGGEFIMGTEHGRSNEKPAHNVKVNGFWMGKYEVTQEQYRAIMNATPSKIKGDRLPVEQISWNNATSFCEKFSVQHGVEVRLPYEAEWEYACRAGSTTQYFWGNSMNGAYCWYKGNSGGIPHPVGQKKPNRWGLYDMSGNVWEYCMDVFSETYFTSSPYDNPTGPTSGVVRVVRGGSYYGSMSTDGTACVRSSFRFGASPDIDGGSWGFRIVLAK